MHVGYQSVRARRYDKMKQKCLLGLRLSLLINDDY